ncbi:alpha/beta fold hydrolase [Actinomadura syzygii]|uniref:Alpha/beta fold hydrolase n=1 Tax=Actinomadura syzygii TaxID=1427538 RepID=A0A5D0TQ92_9ACTN|nr:alpha/beta fold hydrolase [Actinomadura syzygii]TYC07506.1 alpha/beta fold hydrolase [Actinomadura syzygii]
MTAPRADVWTRPRHNLRLTPDGGWAAALCRYDDESAPQVEIWRRRGDSWSVTPTGTFAAVTDQLLPLPGGRVLVRCGDGTRRLRLVGPDSATTVARTAEPSVRLLPAPPGDPDTRCVLAAYDERTTRLYRLTAADRLVRCPGELPGRTEDGVWLGARRLALTLFRSGGAATVVADLATGRARPLLDVGPNTIDRAELYSPASTALVVRTDAGGADRIGFARLGADEAFWFPAETSSDRGLRPLALDPDGRRLLTHEQCGVHSELAVYDIADRVRKPLPTPPGAQRGPAAWTDEGIVTPWSAPTAPTAMLRLRPGHPPPSPVPVPGVSPARVVTVEGAAGPLEAIAYGGDGWLHAPTLVVALHGGPLSAWRYEFHPLLSALADDGVGVLAVNQRGSTGYGAEHVRPIRGGWGGPDLDDVTAVLADLRERRGDASPPAVLGHSYGAFLALLAACAAPGQVSGCVAIAPFRSAAALHAAGPGPVRDLVRRLDGLRVPAGPLGPRDVPALAGRITAPVLLVHGALDEVIPVRESRALYARFLALGRRPGTDVTYVEVADGGHDPLSGGEAGRATAAVRDFLRSERR